MKALVTTNSFMPRYLRLINARYFSYTYASLFVTPRSILKLNNYMKKILFCIALSTSLLNAGAVRTYLKKALPRHTISFLSLLCSGRSYSTAIYRKFYKQFTSSATNQAKLRYFELKFKEVASAQPLWTQEILKFFKHLLRQPDPRPEFNLIQTQEQLIQEFVITNFNQIETDQEQHYHLAACNVWNIIRELSNQTTTPNQLHILLALLHDVGNEIQREINLR